MQPRSRATGTFVTEEGDSIRRNAESTRLEQVRPSSASKSPKGHLQTARGPGANTHTWEHFFAQGLSALVWSNGWMIYGGGKIQSHHHLQGRRLRRESTHPHTKRLPLPLQENMAVFSGDFMNAAHHSLFGISPIQHVIEDRQGKRVRSLFCLENLGGGGTDRH